MRDGRSNNWRNGLKITLIQILSGVKRNSKLILEQFCEVQLFQMGLTSEWDLKYWTAWYCNKMTYCFNFCNYWFVVSWDCWTSLSIDKTGYRFVSIFINFDDLRKFVRTKPCVSCTENMRLMTFSIVLRWKFLKLSVGPVQYEFYEFKTIFWVTWKVFCRQPTRGRILGNFPL